MASKKTEIDCEKFFRQLETKLSCWEPLATQCGFLSDKIKAIRSDNGSQLSEQAFHMLCMLRKREPTNWPRLLMNGLKICGRQDVVKEVRDFLKEENRPLTPANRNTGGAAGPVTRSRFGRRNVPGLKKPKTVAEFKPKLMRQDTPWYTMMWKVRMISDEPKEGKKCHYFQCYMTDTSRMTVYVKFFLPDKQKCIDVYRAIENSEEANPVTLHDVELEKAKQKYRGSRTSNYNLIYNEHSEIRTK